MKRAIRLRCTASRNTQEDAYTYERGFSTRLGPVVTICLFPVLGISVVKFLYCINE